ncbi:MAG: HlyD family type I secretion periplasmic adaptor subunit [Pseudomonadota bacterium]
MLDNPNNAPKQLNPEIMKLLAEMHAKQQGQQQKIMTKKQAIMTMIAQKIGASLQGGIKNVDRFINFVVKPNDPHRNEVVQTARTPILFGVYVIIFFFGFGGIWSMLAPLNSAAVAMGTLISSSQRQVLNHPSGGIIRKIYVKQGDTVKIGDPIIALDEIRFKTEHDIHLNNYLTSLAAECRLVAERDDTPEIQFSEVLLKDANKPEIQKILSTQQSLFFSRKEVYDHTLRSRDQQIEQARKQIEGLTAKKTSALKTYTMYTERVKASKELLTKGYMHKAAVMELESRQEQAKSEIASTEAEIARNEQEITKIKIDIINFKNQDMESVLKELREVHNQLSQSKEQYAYSKDSLERSILTSPVDGTVNDLKYHTVGSVVPPGQTIAEISPTNDVLVVEAKVSTKNIDSVQIGLNCNLRFSAFKSRTSPVFKGKVVALSSDVVPSDQIGLQRGQEPYMYSARIEIDMDDFNKAAKNRNLVLHPGMDVEVQIITGERTLFRYLLDPITDTMFRAFKEK